jgi:hypothetical protein
MSAAQVVAPAGTPEYLREKQAAGVRARQRLRGTEAAYSRARLRFQAVAADASWGRRDEAELAEAEREFEAAERALRRAQATADGFDAADRLLDLRDRRRV